MKIDLHVHTAHSFDATGSPEEVLNAAAGAGLDGIAITEHGDYERSELFLELAPRFNLAVFVGAEVATAAGHFLVFSEDVRRWNSYTDTGYDPQALIDAVNAAGGAVVAAHPFRLGLGGGVVSNLRGLAALEGCNGGNSDDANGRAHALAEKLSLPCTGGSDAHRPAEIGRCYTVFTAPVYSITELVAALKGGRCRCSCAWASPRALLDGLPRMD